MGDLLKRGADMLARRFQSSVSHSATYVRGLVSCPWDVTPGRADYPIDSVESISVSWNARDYAGPIDQLRAVFGADFEPEPADTIVDVINGFTVTHELRDEDGAKPFAYCDAGQTRVRVHCFEVARV